MKKFLSLVLALVMTMSLVTMAGAKDFTDAAEINYKEAVDVMSALKIVDGDTTGAFNPDGTLTRGAAAKIICNLILGPTTAAALVADTAPFPDVPANHTFAGYIAYCAQQGIINGYTDGTFKPANGLTGYAFMKMLLGALGYDATVEGYVGPNSFINVAKQALAIGLDDGKADFNGVELVTREEAMLYSFNALTSTMVDYNEKIEVNTGDSKVTISGGRYDLYNDYSKDYREDEAAQDDEMQFCEKYFKNLKLDDEVETDEFGRPANTWYIKNTKVGTYTKAADVTYTADIKNGALYSDIDADENYEFDVIVDGEDDVDEKAFAAIKKGTDKLSDAVAENVGNGSLIQVFVDEGVITVINTYLLKVSEDYDDEDEILTVENVADIPVALNDYELSSEDIAGLEDYKEGDYIMVTVADGDVITVAPAEKVTATITEYVHDESLTAGETYKYNVGNENTGVTYTLKSDADIYLDPYGYALYVKAVEAAKKYVYIDEFSRHTSSEKSPLNAYGYFADGTEGEMVVTKIGSTKVYGPDENDYAINTWYTYTEKDGKYELKTIAADKKQAGTYQGNEVIFDYDVSHTDIVLDAVKQGNSKTTFVVLEKDGDVKVYTGVKNTADILADGAATAEAVLTAADGKYTELVFVDGGKVKGGSNSTDVVFMIKCEAQGHDTDDDEYYRYKALVNGDEVTIRVEETVAMAGKEGFLYTDLIRQTNDKKYIIEATPVDNEIVDWDREKYSLQSATDGVVTLDDDTLTIDDQDYYLANGCKIYTIYDQTVKTVSAKALATKDLKYTGCSVTGVMNADGEYTALYIWGTK